MLSGYNALQRNISQRAPWMFAALGFFYYASSLWHAALTQISVLDEGLYLFKGFLFSSNIYTPFQPYGPWTNQLPFAFYIPGWLQQVFGPSLLSGRIAAVGFGLLTYIGLVLVLRKYANWKITSVLLILFALNSAQVKMTALATSQGLVSCLVIWMLYFLLGKDQKNWQIFLGGVLAGLTVMVRINMVVLLPLVLLFIWWQYGWKAALWNGLGIAIFFIGGHAVVWPGVLRIWARWLPLPFLSDWFAPETVSTWDPDNPLAFRVASFFLGFRYHFAALTGGTLSVLWVDKLSLEQRGALKSFVFLYITFVLLYLIHLWAALFNDYCVFCFPTYITFFSIIGFILLAISLTNLRENRFGRKLFSSAVLIFILAGIAYSAEDIFSDAFGSTLYKAILNLPIPGTNAALWQVLANKFALEQNAITKITNSALPTLITSFGALMILILLVAIKKYARSNWLSIRCDVVLVLFFMAAVFTPAKPLAGGYNTYDCDTPVIENYDRIGEELSLFIPDEASVYWAGYSPVTLLHMPQAVIFPAQLHSGYSYRISKESDALLQYGWWNESLARQWVGEADYILVEAKNENENALLANGYADHELVYRSYPQNCRQNSEMLLFRRKP